ncbi:uncharacterized protein VP01_2268g1 [Puccinia sorghi]|uniref:Myb/SANT-like domain-containing protein n=1 Tax=Puccinia sorghi TaxID=27349 RepID=A0A0L6VA53_9BASI|nr:uncharacterized protein VP01_2268g1 [Puccinia sorghi]
MPAQALRKIYIDMKVLLHNSNATPATSTRYPPVPNPQTLTVPKSQAKSKARKSTNNPPQNDSDTKKSNHIWTSDQKITLLTYIIKQINLDQSGFGWDASSGMATTDEETWEALIQASPCFLEIRFRSFLTCCSSSRPILSKNWQHFTQTPFSVKNALLPGVIPSEDTENNPMTKNTHPVRWRQFQLNILHPQTNMRFKLRYIQERCGITCSICKTGSHPKENMKSTTKEDAMWFSRGGSLQSQALQKLSGMFLNQMTTSDYVPFINSSKMRPILKSFFL